MIKNIMSQSFKTQITVESRSAYCRLVVKYMHRVSVLKAAIHPRATVLLKAHSSTVIMIIKGRNWA